MTSWPADYLLHCVHPSPICSGAIELGCPLPFLILREFEEGEIERDKESEKERERESDSESEVTACGWLFG
jgi:hypothetical protein